MNSPKNILRHLKTGKKTRSFNVYWNKKHRVEVFSSNQNGANAIDYLQVRFDKIDYCIYLNESDYTWECIPEHGCDIIAKSGKLDEVLSGAQEHTRKISEMHKQIMSLGRKTTPPRKTEPV